MNHEINCDTVFPPQISNCILYFKYGMCLEFWSALCLWKTSRVFYSIHTKYPTEIIRLIMVVNRKLCFLVKDLNGNNYILCCFAYYISFISEGNCMTLWRKITHADNQHALHFSLTTVFSTYILLVSY